MVPAGRGGSSGAGPGRGGQPTQAGRVPGVRPTKPGLTDPMADYGQLYRPTAPPAAPPARRSRRTLAVVLAACVVVAAAGGAYLAGEALRIIESKHLLPLRPEDAEAIEWINQNTNSSDVLVCYHDPAYFLYTGRKASRSLPMEEWVDWREDRTSVETVRDLVFRTLEQDKGRYLVVTSADFEAEDQTGRYGRVLGSIIDSHPDKFTPVFNSGDGRSRIFRVEDVE